MFTVKHYTIDCNTYLKIKGNYNQNIRVEMAAVAAELQTDKI